MKYLKVFFLFIFMEQVFGQKMRPRPRPIKLVLNNTRQILPLVENATNGSHHLLQNIIQNMELSFQILDNVSTIDNKVDQLIDSQEEGSLNIEKIKTDLAVVQSNLDSVADSVLEIVPTIEAKLEQLFENNACSGPTSKTSIDEKGIHHLKKLKIILNMF